ncbi:MAG: DUF2189 domain-containing protein [Rhizobiaceae bacterium]
MSNFHVMAGRNVELAHPSIRRIGMDDLVDALRLGWRDFMEMPSHLMFLAIIYPIVGVFLAAWTSGTGALPMLFPLMSGFALLGPVAAVGLYEISRRREAGMTSTWRNALDVRHSPALPSIIALGLLLFALFIAWLLTARALYISLFGDVAPSSIGAMLAQIFGTTEGWTLLVTGNLIGFCFAVVVLATTVVAFPLLLDRDIGAVAAIQTSVRATLANPIAMLAWGLIVAVALAIGSIPLFAGLAIVLPVLGHATWHLYRKVIGN